MCELKEYAHEAIWDMLSYNVSKTEAYKYLTNKVKLCKCSYELQCCIYDLDPVEYCREADKQKK